jgi:hypothetical protein
VVEDADVGDAGVAAWTTSVVEDADVEDAGVAAWSWMTVAA